MCGISGFLSKERTISGIEFYKAHNLLADRGPDDEGFIIEKDNKPILTKGERTVEHFKYLEDIREIGRLKTVIGHVRLSIIELSDRGHQPMLDEDNGIILAYNGEIFNYKELRIELERIGCQFRTNSDTEVVLKSYITWGQDCFSKFNGMWALAIYESKTKSLLLCRDRFGVKPLYYSIDGQSLCFASEMKVLHSLKKNVVANEEAINKYLRDCKLCDEEETFFRGIKEVNPGEYIQFKEEKSVKYSRYWNFCPVKSAWTLQDAEEKFKYLFEDAVRLRMRSDVEVGSLVSGGLDSNTIVGTIAVNGQLSSHYKTYSSVYKEEKFSEKKYIDLTVEKYGLDSHLIYMEPMEVLDNLDKELYRTEMPLRSAAPILQYILYDNIKRSSNVKVVLNGQGADELFGGYNGDYLTRFLHLLETFHLKKMISEISAYRNIRHRGIKQIAFGMYSKAKISHRRGNAFNDISFNQITNTPLREYLMYDDRASMAFGIETRAPFLDYRLVEFAFSLDSDYKINKAGNKILVRNYGKGIVPKEILDRKDKMGFVSPQEVWQRNEWKDVFDNAFNDIRRNGLFHLSGSELFNEYYIYKNKKNDDWARIWRVFCLYRWKQIFN